MMLTSSKNPNFITKLDFLAKLNIFNNIFEKYEVRALLWKVDVRLTNQSKYQNNFTPTRDLKEK